MERRQCKFGQTLEFADALSRGEIRFRVAAGCPPGPGGGKGERGNRESRGRLGSLRKLLERKKVCYLTLSGARCV